MPDNDLPGLLAVASRTVTVAGEALAAEFARRPRCPKFATWADLKKAFYDLDAMSSSLVRDPLSEALPGARWLEEDWEFGTEVPTEGDVWVLDAVEGAIQFIHGLAEWVVSLALVRDGEPVLSVMHSPGLSETYTAIRGGGAFLNGEAVTPSVKTDLAAAFVATGYPPFVSKDAATVAATARGTGKLLAATLAIRNFGPTSWQVADVASGRIDAFWQYGQDPANLLPGALLVTEAGGTVSDAAGRPWRFGSDTFVAGPASLRAQIVATLA